jgi:hypothetical protein
MASAARHRLSEAEGDEVVRWRKEELRRAGYGERAVRTLAREADVDLHLAIQLLARGCPERVALRILL